MSESGVYDGEQVVEATQILAHLAEIEEMLVDVVGKDLQSWDLLDCCVAHIQMQKSF